MNLLYPYVRFFNASPQGGKKDFYIGNTLVASGVGFGEVTPYIKTVTPSVFCKCIQHGFKNEGINKLSLNQHTGDVHTVCLVGKADKPELMAISENAVKDHPEYGHLRICNLSPEGGGFDVFAGGTKILGDVQYKEISRYMEIRPEEYELTLMKNKKTVSSCGKTSLKPGKFNTVYIIGMEKENPEISGVFTVDKCSYRGFYL